MKWLVILCCILVDCTEYQKPRQEIGLIIDWWVLCDQHIIDRWFQAVLPKYCKTAKMKKIIRKSKYKQSYHRKMFIVISLSRVLMLLLLMPLLMPCWLLLYCTFFCFEMFKVSCVLFRLQVSTYLFSLG